MMLKKHAVFSIALLSSAMLYAIPVESRGLSQSGTSGNNSAPAASNMNWDLIQKNQQLENQLRELRGKIEEQDHAIDQLNKELTNRYTDLDQRLELLNQKVDPESSQTDDAGSTGSTPTEAPADTAQPDAGTPASSAPPEPAAVPQKTEEATTSVNGNNTAVNTSNPRELEKAAYTVALDAYKKGGAKQAIQPMQNFIKNNPDSIYTGNAYFWLAEFNLAIDPPNYNEAKKHYETVASKFPKSSKAPRALFQLYNIAREVNKNTATANVYKTKLLNSYPHSEEAGYFKKA
ncbi:YbgF trimerization domain-containing protein [Acinetobacter sp. WZC-1]|uniref:YbgF trimerization domain-containing protein n=1 Tax=Acinetobacter sp. WZC-1 TaxID=3459034 RepID=UPI00403D8E33